MCKCAIHSPCNMVMNYKCYVSQFFWIKAFCLDKSRIFIVYSYIGQVCDACQVNPISFDIESDLELWERVYKSQMTAKKCQLLSSSVEQEQKTYFSQFIWLDRVIRTIDEWLWLQLPACVHLTHYNWSTKSTIYLIEISRQYWLTLLTWAERFTRSWTSCS